MAETVTWSGAGYADSVIASAADGVFGLQVNGKPLLEVITLLRASVAIPRNRGNLLATVSLSVVYAPAASVAAARVAIATLSAALAAGKGSAPTLVHAFGANTMVLSNAQLSSWDLDAGRGRTVTGKFTFVGSAISST